MKNGVVALIVILVIVVLGAVWFGGTYNSVVALGENVDAKWAQIENQLQRRYDLVPDLVKVANKYAAHEKDTIEAVVNARAKLSGANTVEDEIGVTDDEQKYLGVMKKHSLVNSKLRVYSNGNQAKMLEYLIKVLKALNIDAAGITVKTVKKIDLGL